MMVKKNHPVYTMVENSLVSLPTPSSISYLWNWGSMMGMILIVQIITGILLASHYNPSIYEAFNSIVHITRNINSGFELRFIHMNSASLFFICLFIHVSRGMNMSSYKLWSSWGSGVVIILILMATAFLGYVLPWGQMSFWGATVITNLVSAIPYMGKQIVEWLWGGFSISNATLNRFFSLHFLMPFILAFIVIIHLASLHITGSNKPTGNNPNMDKIFFHPFFSTKDLVTIMALAFTITCTSFFFPFCMGDPENFNMANPLNTPIHIQPEWYFLFAYAILRSIPNKLGGVTALVLSILSLSFLTITKKNKTSKKWMPNFKLSFWVYAMAFIVLTWLGAMPVEEPFENISKIFSWIYFMALTIN